MRSAKKNASPRSQWAIMFFLLVGVIAGLGIGLWYAWMIDPVEWSNAIPAQLRSDVQEDYLRMAVESYIQTKDETLARRRYASLGEQAVVVLQRINDEPGGLDGAAVAAFQEAVKIPHGGATTQPSQGVATRPDSIWVLGMLAAGALAGGIFYGLQLLVQARSALRQASSRPIVVDSGFRKQLRRWNWPLILGGSIVLLFALLAWKGPDWAPHDPMEENYALAVNGQIVRPPYPAFAVPGYPLGTDAFGRDILSRIMWGIRPTMVTVVLVSGVRLLLGVLLGLIIGWAGGIPGRVLDWLLSLALSVPVLFVALMGITAVGVHKGLISFIVGLSLTGWAETARLVSDQTRITRNMIYVEAARALGASDTRILFSHILRQIMPLVWMLVAFEVSATLLVSAELGFLGYYIGGGVWIEISDFVSVNTTGLPELGQMLSTSLITLVKPWTLIIVGFVIFLAIMGFNLLGEGLRLRVNRQLVMGGRKSFLLRGAFGEWVESILSPAITNWFEANALRLTTGVLVMIILGGWSIWYRSRPVELPVSEQQRLAIPGDQLWATARHDAQGTLWAPVQGPRNAELLWMAPVSGDLTGGPVVASDGTIYVSTQDKFLYAFSVDGEQLWQVRITVLPVASPALGAGGEIYISDIDGGLTAFDSTGVQLWHFIPQEGREATSGPIVSADGVIYYARVDHIQAVSSQGEHLWLAYALDAYAEQPPSLSAGGSFIFLKNAALAAGSGAPLALDGIGQDEPVFNTPTFFTGANAKTYYRSAHTVSAWASTENGVEMEAPITWTPDQQIIMPPMDQGMTPSGLVWLFYSSSYADTRVVWIDAAGKLIGNVRLPERDGRVIGLDGADVIYACHANFSTNLTCTAVAPKLPQPIWSVSLQTGDVVVGGALVDGRIYVAVASGTLYALGEK
jgi:peptide/nickel transport system permease protein